MIKYKWCITRCLLSQLAITCKIEVEFRRTKVNETSDYTIIDNVKGAGHFVGVYLAWQVNNNE